jgi:hypothetical protein
MELVDIPARVDGTPGEVFDALSAAIKAIEQWDLSGCGVFVGFADSTGEARLLSVGNMTVAQLIATCHVIATEQTQLLICPDEE